MNESVSAIEPWLLTVVSVGLFGWVALLAYQKKTAGAFVALLGAALSGGFLYLDHISEIAATATSLTIKVREASDALVGLRKVAALTGGALINLDGLNGQIGGDPAEHRDQLKERVLETLRSIGIDETTMRQVEDQSHDRDVLDFVAAIISHVEYCVLDPAHGRGWPTDVMKEKWPPTPNYIQSVLEKYGVHDDFTDKALDEYRYFLRTGEHRDVQFWRDRDSWPTADAVANPDSKRKCR